MKKFMRIIKRFALFFWLKLCHILFFVFNKKSSNLLQYHNIHKGKRVFIVATGPSLRFEDLDKIKNEYTIS